MGMWLLARSCWSVADLSESLWPSGLWPARVLCPWDFPSKDTGVDYHFLLQRIFPTQGLNPDPLLGRWVLYHWTTRGAQSLLEQPPNQANRLVTHLFSVPCNSDRSPLSMLRTPLLSPGESRGRRSLLGCRPRGRWESGMTERLHVHVSLSCAGEGMATHSSVPAWRIPGTGEPAGLPAMGSHRVGQDWSDLAAAAEHPRLELTQNSKIGICYLLTEGLAWTIWMGSWSLAVSSAGWHAGVSPILVLLLTCSFWLASALRSWIKLEGRKGGQTANTFRGSAEPGTGISTWHSLVHLTL